MDGSGTVDAQLTGPRLVLRGTLKADQASFVLPDESTPSLGADVVVRRRSDAPRNGGTGASAGQRVEPDIQLNLDLGDAFDVRGLGLEARLGGRLQLISTPQQPAPRVLGEVSTESSDIGVVAFSALSRLGLGDVASGLGRLRSGRRGAARCSPAVGDLRRRRRLSRLGVRSGGRGRRHGDAGALAPRRPPAEARHHRDGRARGGAFMVPRALYRQSRGLRPAGTGGARRVPAS